MNTRSKRIRCLFAFVLTAGAVVGTVRAQETVEEIVRKSEALMRGQTQQGVQTMTIVRPEWERSMTFSFWSEGMDKSFIHITDPAKERGVAFLKLDREMWQYVPRVNRVIKIPPSMMLQSWMGSDFTNDDLVKESSWVEDYDAELLGWEALGGEEAYKVAFTARPDAPVAWDRVVEWIRRSDYVPLKAIYYNERGEQVRTLLFSDFERTGTRIYPMRMELIEDTRPGRKTVLVVEEITFDKPLPSSVFTQQNLRRSR